MQSPQPLRGFIQKIENRAYRNKRWDCEDANNNIWYEQEHDSGFSKA
jgi:hypothetical protein